MRTTLDLPDELLRRAKIVAIERRCTSRALFTQALEHELKRPAPPPAQRPQLPFLEVRDDCPALQLHPGQFESIDADAEAGQALAIHRRR